MLFLLTKDLHKFMSPNFHNSEKRNYNFLFQCSKAAQFVISMISGKDWEEGERKKISCELNLSFFLSFELL